MPQNGACCCCCCCAAAAPAAAGETFAAATAGERLAVKDALLIGFGETAPPLPAAAEEKPCPYGLGVKVKPLIARLPAA